MHEPKPPQTKETATPPLVGTRRLNPISWNQPGDRQLCPWSYAEPPETTPHVFRHQIASPRMVVVDRTSASVLLCNRLHEGPCRWPGGEDIGEIDEVRDAEIKTAAAAMAADTLRSSASPRGEAPPREPAPPRRR